MSGRLRAAMIQRPHLQQTVTRPHQWLDQATLESVQHEFQCFRCQRTIYEPFGSDELDEEGNLAPETGGNCPKWQAQ